MIETVTYARDPRNVQQARRFVGARLAGQPPQLVDRTILMVSELVTNSLRHASGPIMLTLEVTDDALRVAVGDDGPSKPIVRNPSPEEMSGRGLRIVSALADEWGVSSDEDSRNIVWFCLTLKAQEPSDMSERDREGATGGSQ